MAFANADGGEIAIGIDEVTTAEGKGVTIQGFDDSEAMNGVLQSLFSLTPTLDIKYTVFKSDSFPGYVSLSGVKKAEVF